MHLIALLLRSLLLLYYPFLASLWLRILAIEYFFLVNKWYIFLPVLFFMILLVLPLVHIPWACRCLFWGTPDDEMETRLPRRKMKGLVRFVRNVAGTQDLPEQDLIRFHAESVAHVYINGDKEKVLVLGGLALRCLSQDALARPSLFQLSPLRFRYWRCRWRGWAGRVSRRLRPGPPGT
jgi:hypothetical protein